jgi:site-specific DNA-methyltransferase (adenine-specific)
MDPYWADDSMTLYQGDSLAVLQELPSASVDCLLTDPPYSSGGMVRGDRMGNTRAKYVQSDSGSQALEDFSGDNRDQRAYAYWSALWIGECLRVLKPGAVGALFTDWRQLPATTDALQAGGFVWRGLVPWAKTTYRPQAGRFAAQCEYVVWGTAGSRSINYEDDCLPGFCQAASPREREHITQKPLDVMRELVKICPPGGVILDPFMGSGTTGVAAITEGRRFIGVEMSPHYAGIARDRLTQVVTGISADNPAQGALL